ncbi:MAG: hypothetical protein IJ874_08770 [Ruminococcus sp.]|nr:hypothetical protein [Ruminococcus sp.]
MIFEILDKLNDEDEQSLFGADTERYKTVCAICYVLPILFFLPIIFDSGSEFCKFHGNQQFLWLIAVLALAVISMILGAIPLIGWIMQVIIVMAIIAGMALLAIGAYKGYAVKLPIVGDAFTLFK